MAVQPLPALPSGDPSVWDQALYAFLVEKGNRSGSRRTVESYSRMLWPFFAGRTPEQIRPPDVLAYAHGIGRSGRTPSAATIGARIACLSSESVNGLYKAELIRRQRTWRTVEDVELATAGWVDWWNERRLHSACGDVPPAEFEAAYARLPEVTSAA